MNNWIKEAIIYEIFPRVFSDEGNFQGIINRLPELKDLGVNTLWLMPVQKIGKINRKGTLGSPYSIRDYYSVNPDLGTEKDFHKLVKLSHKNGFRIILDWVAMYTAWDHLWTKQHPDWYRKNEQGEIIFPPDTDWYDIAHLNYGNPE
ncbi:MAG: alpha-amylase, partial [Elusimicrobia bacterium]|nr:alpha-amylase [Elusimicrobiota bacterium]